MDTGVEQGRGRESRYYIAQGRGCDHLLRCKDCQKLVKAVDLCKLGCCPCGCKRVVEITTLSEDEHKLISDGILDFPHRDLFLAEFNAVG